MVRTFVRGCMCAVSWCDLDLTFDLVIVTLTFKIFVAPLGLSFDAD